MLSFFDYFYANFDMYQILMVSAFVIAYIFVLILEKYFNITLKNPMGKVDIGSKDPVGKIPCINNPVGKIPRPKKGFWRF